MDANPDMLLPLPTNPDMLLPLPTDFGCSHYRETHWLLSLPTDFGCSQQLLLPLPTDFGCSHYRETHWLLSIPTDSLLSLRRDFRLLAIMRCHNMCTRVPLLWARQHHWIDVRGQTYLVSPCRLQNTSFRMVKLYHRSPNGHPARLPFGYIPTPGIQTLHMSTPWIRYTPGSLLKFQLL